MRRPLLVLIACLLLWAPPAEAQTPDGSERRTPPETLSEALPPVEQEETPFSIAVLPLPFVAVYSIMGWENIRLGPTRHNLRLRGGYVWTTNVFYAPTQIQKQQPDPPDQKADFYHLIADWEWKLGDRVSLALFGYGAGGGLVDTPGYDPELLQGLSLTGGPHLRYSTLDELAFPTAGTWVEAGYSPGYHWGPVNLAFSRVNLDASHYVPLGEDRTLALRAVAKAAWPKLAWVDKYFAGGGFNLRGHQWNRFTGDRLLSATAEYRHLFWKDIFKTFGWDLGLAVGLGWQAYVDAGRAWESTQGVPFLSDPRLGAGAGLTLTIDRAPLGRLECSVSPEGLYVPVASFGAAF